MKELTLTKIFCELPFLSNTYIIGNSNECEDFINQISISHNNTNIICISKILANKLINLNIKLAKVSSFMTFCHYFLNYLNKIVNNYSFSYFITLTYATGLCKFIT